MSELAINGGMPVRDTEFKKFNTLGIEEKNAVASVMDSGILSAYFGKSGEGFLGGDMVQKFERDWAKYFNVKHAITVNSWTSGLVTMVSALDLPKGEIITSSWTMCATAAAIIHAGHTPIFADIDPVDFCLDPIDVEKKITSKTRALLIVDIHGGSAQMEELLQVAQKYNLKVICDSAQSPGGKYKNKFTGTLGDIGGFSLNYHKHIHTGEGGVIVTDSDELAFKCQLIRNHAEAYVPNQHQEKLIGHNFRLGEIECAIGIEQLKKLDSILIERKKIANSVIELISKYDFISVPEHSKDIDHVYYVIPVIYKSPNRLFNRDWFVSALQAEGLKNVYGGFANIHELPYFKKNFPTNDPLLIAEKMHQMDFICFQNCMYQLSDETEKKQFHIILEKVLNYVSKNR
jgi:dTDP-4-amino-4,6-dideoxygalactose transaminase